MVTEERSREALSVVDLVAGWAAGHEDVRGVVVVGSWARGTARMDSDVDVVVLTDNAGYAEPEVWTGLLAGEVVRSADWGPLREVRVRRRSGFEVELGVTPVSWAGTDPVDPGTRRVISDGHRVVHDPAGQPTRRERHRARPAGSRPMSATPVAGSRPPSSM
ncbi:nucleotidyltransferase domain-containing protein [Micromonospora sp. NPDC048930]|uniref:nucleotidyltransferase domain-containing protein n=1 Tax=Micromonospora sp. NPDC048930 TaxID=3364261 RepID=UPI00371FB417